MLGKLGHEKDLMEEVEALGYKLDKMEANVRDILSDGENIVKNMKREENLIVTVYSGYRNWIPK